MAADSSRPKRQSKKPSWLQDSSFEMDMHAAVGEEDVPQGKRKADDWEGLEEDLDDSPRGGRGGRGRRSAPKAKSGRGGARGGRGGRGRVELSPHHHLPHHDYTRHHRDLMGGLGELADLSAAGLPPTLPPPNVAGGPVGVSLRSVAPPQTHTAPPGVLTSATTLIPPLSAPAAPTTAPPTRGGSPEEGAKAQEGGQSAELHGLADAAAVLNSLPGGGGVQSPAGGAAAAGVEEPPKSPAKAPAEAPQEGGKEDIEESPEASSSEF